jgi:hypothetical protein
MADHVILHIGLQKSGTTYLQRVLQECVEAVGEAGLTYPLPPARRRRRQVESHEWPSYGLLGTEYPWVSERRARNERENWNRLARQIHRSRRPVLLSAEALSVIRAPAIDNVIEALAADRVDVVITARSLGRTLPSLWQQHVRNGRGTSFDRYLRRLAGEREHPGDDIEKRSELHLWRAFALGRLVRRWGNAVGLDRVRVVTSTGSPPRTLWARFAEAVGAPDLADAPPWHLLDLRTHSGLTDPETQVLMWLNTALREAEWSGQAAGDLRERIVLHGFMTRQDRGPRIVVPPPWRERVAGWCAEDTAELEATGVRIIGDIADLRYEPEPAPDSESASAPDREADAGTEPGTAAGTTAGTTAGTGPGTRTRSRRESGSGDPPRAVHDEFARASAAAILAAAQNLAPGH